MINIFQQNRAHHSSTLDKVENESLHENNENCPVGTNTQPNDISDNPVNGDEGQKELLPRQRAHGENTGNHGQDARKITSIVGRKKP